MALTYNDIARVKRGRWSDADIERAYKSRERCNLCPHFCDDPDTGYVKVRSRGTRRPKVLVVGEAPGGEEAQEGYAFVGRAARHLGDLIVNAGADAEKFRFTNVTRCFPHNPDLSPKNPPSYKDAMACMPYLYEEIEECQPAVILTLGDFASKCILGDVLPIGRIATRVFSTKIGGREYSVVPSHHPSADLRAFGRHTNSIVNAINAAWSLTDRREVPVVSHVINDTNEAIDYLESLLRAYKQGEIKYVAYDLEWASLIDFGKKRNEADRDSTLDLYNKDVKLVAASFATKIEEGFTIILDHVESQVDYDRLVPLLGKVVSTIPVVVHGHSCAETPWSRTRLGVDIKLHDDTMLMSYAVYAQTRSHGLKVQARRLGGWSDWSLDGDAWFNNQKDPTRRSYRHMPLAVMSRYASIDPCATLLLRSKLLPKINKLDLWETYNRRLQASWVMQPWEAHGAPIDMEMFERITRIYNKRVARLTKTMRRFRPVRRFQRDYDVVFNPKSTQHQQAVIYSYCGAPIGRTSPRLKRDDELAVVLRKDLEPGTTILPIMSNLKPAKSVWIGRANGQRGSERVEIKEVTPVGVMLKKPTRFEHKQPVVILKGTPSCDEKEMFRILRRLQCGICKSTGVDPEEKNSKCHACDGAGVHPDNVDFYEFMRTLRINQRIKTIIGSYLTEKKGKGIRAHLVPGTNIVTAQYLFHIVATGRLSVKNMNIHSFPADSDIRHLVVSQWFKKGGTIFSGDYSQLEVKILACVSGDETLCRAYLTCGKCEKVWDLSTNGVCPNCDVRLGVDLHTVTAAVLFNRKIAKLESEGGDVSKLDRSMAKSTVFGLIYGRGAEGISEETGLPLDEAQSVIDKFFERFPSVSEYVETMHSICHMSGQYRSATGTLLHFNGWDSQDRKVIAEAERASQNYPVQGPAGELALDAIIRLAARMKKKKLRSVMWESTHDSISIDTAPGEVFQVCSTARSVMERAIMKLHASWLKVPITSDQEIGVRWSGGLAIEAIDGDTIKLKGKKEFLEELVPALEVAYRVKSKITKEWDEKPADEVFNTKGYAGGSGRLDHVEATLRLVA